MSELSPGQVTVADLYKELVGMRGELGQLVIGYTLAEDRHKTATATDNDHEARIRTLERGWWKAAGGAAVLSVVVSLVTALITIRVR